MFLFKRDSCHASIGLFVIDHICKRYHALKKLEKIQIRYVTRKNVHDNERGLRHHSPSRFLNSLTPGMILTWPFEQPTLLHFHQRLRSSHGSEPACEQSHKLGKEGLGADILPPQQNRFGGVPAGWKSMWLESEQKHTALSAKSILHAYSFN